MQLAKHPFFAFLFFFIQHFVTAQAIVPIPFDGNKNYSATYDEIMDFWKRLDTQFREVKLVEYGYSDVGRPIHLVVVSKETDFTPDAIRSKGKSILFINNAIHAGEPCGVEASMLLVRDYLTNSEFEHRLDNVALIIIPAYNIGGVLNRNNSTRTNQQGPEWYGFRGNAKNLDLNRDFIKCDSRNARAFTKIMRLWDPDVFIDTHTSNGADYSYTITLIASQWNKQEEGMAKYAQLTMIPELYRAMSASGWEMTPYVYARDTPDKGIAGFLDLPRYSSGYAALFNTFSFITESHMLKPFADRVAATYTFLDNMTQFLNKEGRSVQKLRQLAKKNTADRNMIDVNWTLDPTKVDTLFFEGYQPGYKPSEISGYNRLWYNRKQPLNKMIPFYNTYKATTTIEKPKAYIIPQAYDKVIERLRINGIPLKRLTRDTIIEVYFYRIRAFETTDEPYESHYLHSQVVVSDSLEKVQFFKGDYIAPTGLPTDNYLVHVLEPQAADSFFAWNFFDGILMQKEYFSPYVFEDLAAEYLSKHPELQKQLEEKRNADPDFKASAYLQLKFVYEHSPWHEVTYRRYPIGRLGIGKK